MNYESKVVLFYCLYLLLPVLVAGFFYAISSDGNVSAKGKLSGLKIKTTGAFASWLIVVLVGSPFLNKLVDQQNHVQEDEWKISAKIELMADNQNVVLPVDSFGNQIAVTRLLTLTTAPDFKTIDGNRVTMTFREPRKSLIQRTVTFSIPGFTSYQVDFGEEGQLRQRNGDEHSLELTKPVLLYVIKKENTYNPNAAPPLAALPIQVPPQGSMQ